MAQPRSVNDTLDRIDELRGHAVEVEGVLDVVFVPHLGLHEYGLLHYPAAERGRASGPARGERLFLEFGTGSIRPNEVALARWEGKRVRVHGVAWPPEVSIVAGLSDAAGAYSPRLDVYSIQRVTSGQRRERGDPGGRQETGG